MPELKQLDTLELFGLYEKVIAMRKQVLDLVQEYGFDANQLVSQTFERSIEAEYGKKILKKTRKRSGTLNDYRVTQCHGTTRLSQA